jgi:3-oxoacyl-[acyl-carrier protein] reductase
MNLEGRVALISGANRGVGKGIALGLAKDGAAIALNYRRDEASALETIAEIEALGGRVIPYQASVDDDEAVATMVEKVAADFGKIDILVNNAGIASRGQSVADTDPAEMRRVVGVHCFGTFYMTHAVLPHMRKSDRGDIIMITSAATRDMMPNGAPYSIGKVGAEAIAQTVAKEERHNNIRVNIVSPGLVDTDMGKRLTKATRGLDDIHDLDAGAPFGHVCQPEDVANVVRFLVSAQNSYVTGERIYVDGYKGATNEVIQAP